MRNIKHLVFAGLLTTSALTGAVAPHMAMAQPVPAGMASSPPVFDAAAKRQAITAAAKLLTDDYVFPDVGAQAGAMLTKNFDAGKYDAVATPDDFAAMVTKDLQDLTHDKHLHVEADGRPPMQAPPPGGRPRPLGLYLFDQADRLKGNIGYIVLNGFVPKNDFRRGADKAMALIASTDALIIDLRNNGGGAPASVSYLVSFFFDGKTPVHVNDLLWRKAGTPDYNRQVFSTEPTPVSYLGKPVYLITSARTFSGAEEFAYDMQALKRATVVGDVTGGGAHPGGVEPIGPGLSLWVPMGRSDSPVTHADWEGKGVQPDIAIAADHGFAKAYAEALHAVGHPAQAPGDSAEAVTEAHLLVPPRTSPLPGSEDLLRRWEAGMASGHPPYDLMSDELVKMTHEDQAFLQGDLSRRGPLQSLKFAEVDLNGGDVYEATFADKSSVQFTIILGTDGKIVSLFGQPY